MARFGVLDHNQRDTDQPRWYFDEPQVLILLSRNQAVLLNRRLIRRCSPGSPIKRAQWPIPQPAGKLIKMVDGKVVSQTGFGLPPREVAGCFFQPPQSDSWRLEHRTVTFMPNVPRETLPANSL